MGQGFFKDTVYVSDADGDFTRYFKAPAIGGKWLLHKVEIMSHAALTASGTNYATLSIYGTDLTTKLATDRATSSTGFSAGVSEGMTMALGTKAVFDVADEGKIVGVKTGTGVAVELDFVITWRQIRA